jgi:hypothetical protein
MFGGRGGRPWSLSWDSASDQLCRCSFRECTSASPPNIREQANESILHTNIPSRISQRNASACTYSDQFAWFTSIIPPTSTSSSRRACGCQRSDRQRAFIDQPDFSIPPSISHILSGSNLLVPNCLSRAWVGSKPKRPKSNLRTGLSFSPPSLALISHHHVHPDHRTLPPLQPYSSHITTTAPTQPRCRTLNSHSHRRPTPSFVPRLEKLLVWESKVHALVQGNEHSSFRA